MNDNILLNIVLCQFLFYYWIFCFVSKVFSASSSNFEQTTQNRFIFHFFLLFIILKVKRIFAGHKSNCNKYLPEHPQQTLMLIDHLSTISYFVYTIIKLNILIFDTSILLNYIWKNVCRTNETLLLCVLCWLWASISIFN